MALCLKKNIAHFWPQLLCSRATLDPRPHIQTPKPRTPILKPPKPRTLILKPKNAEPQFFNPKNLIIASQRRRWTFGRRPGRRLWTPLALRRRPCGLRVWVLGLICIWFGVNGYIGIMEKKMETTVQGLGFRAYKAIGFVGLGCGLRV